MLTQTSELSLRALLVLALGEFDAPVSPRELAGRLRCSPTYLAKTLGLLTRAGILHSVRGAHGGVLLARSPESIELLDVVEACQGFLVANYCRSLDAFPGQTCAFHRAMKEIHETSVAMLRRWTLADLVADPLRRGPDGQPSGCKMDFEGGEGFIVAQGMVSEPEDD
jgi:Rrf2 family protein